MFVTTHLPQMTRSWCITYTKTNKPNSSYHTQKDIYANVMICGFVSASAIRRNVVIPCPCRNTCSRQNSSCQNDPNQFFPNKTTRDIMCACAQNAIHDKGNLLHGRLNSNKNSNKFWINEMTVQKKKIQNIFFHKK